MPDSDNLALSEKLLALTPGTSELQNIILKVAANLVKQLDMGYRPSKRVVSQIGECKRKKVGAVSWIRQQGRADDSGIESDQRRRPWVASGSILF